MSKKTAIITYTDANNPGALLQAYALEHVIRSITDDVCCQIDHRAASSKIFRQIRGPRDILYDAYYLFTYGARKRRNQRYALFRQDYLHMTKPCHTPDKLWELNNQFDYFISGSDQVWNCQKGMYKPFFLNFVQETEKKFTYAASMGKTDVPIDFIPEFQKAVSSFAAISVREDQVAEFLQQFQVSAEVVCDPVFLLNKNEWLQMISQIRKGIHKPYIFVYTTEMNEEFKSRLKELKNRTGMDVISMRKISGIRSKTVLDLGPLEFVWYIANAACVMTNSFHATAFSIILNKPLYCILHKTRGERMSSLLRKLELEDCIIQDHLPAQQIIVDWCNVEKQLNVYTSTSKEFLQRILGGE